MTNWIYWLVLNVGLAVAVWFGFVDGVQGAQYLVTFFVWAIAVPLGAMAFTDAMQTKMAAEPPTPVRSFVGRIIAWFVLGVLVWTGHLATATAWAFWLLAAAVCRESVTRKRAAVAAKEMTP